MIKTFGDNQTAKIWSGNLVKKLPNGIQHVALRKLRMINNAQEITDLRIPPANKLEKLKGIKVDYYSIRINGQWRFIFQWINNDAYEVQIIDYHK